MAFRGGNLVNKQFNSPIKLYSPGAVSEAMEKQKQVLANGAVGIDFHNLAKPGNLANSAVLRMLEEEEKSGRSGGLKRVAWPPPPEDPIESQPLGIQEPVYAQGGPHTTSTHGLGVKTTPPHSPQFSRNHEPTQSISPQHLDALRDSPVNPIVFHPVKFEPPRATVTLRASPPIRQEPAPVYASQPVAATVQGGQRMRGDQKWPPESVKQQSQVENEARIALAKGPVFRPRKVKKDYSEFFAQHALNSTYPGYRAPPGTQHYSEGTSNF